MKKIFFVLTFFCLTYNTSAFCEEIEISSEVISVGTDAEFFIIGSGEDAGIEIGDGFIVHRDGDRIAGAQIIEVRPTVSAAEILEIKDGKKIMEGDKVFFVKQIRTEPLVPHMVTSSPKRDYVSAPSIVEEAELVSIKIYKDPKAVFTYSSLVLRENGYSVISSDRATGTILATKPITLSIIKELLADATAAIDHKVALSLEIKGEGDSSTLTASTFKEHSQKEKHIKRAVRRNSKYYNEAALLLSKIKERSEY